MNRQTDTGQSIASRGKNIPSTHAASALSTRRQDDDETHQPSSPLYVTPSTIIHHHHPPSQQQQQQPASLVMSFECTGHLFPGRPPPVMYHRGNPLFESNPKPNLTLKCDPNRYVTLLLTPPHLKYVATLPRSNLLLIACFRH